MATEQIIVEYIADIQGFKAQLKGVEDTMKKVETTGKESAKSIQKEFQSTGASLKEGFKDIATSLGLAFGVHKVIEFGKESIKAFAEAEQNANKLKFALEKIGGEGSAAFKKLIEQSEKLQKSTIFSDDAIQQSQTALVQFGLTSKQVEQLIPQIADLASATGTDLASATQKAIQGINGQTRGLKEVGISYADTGSKTQNLALLTEKLTKFNGASADAMETVTGKAKRLENAFGDIQEKIGEYLVNEGADILDNFETIFGGQSFDELSLRKQKEKILGVMDEVNTKTLEKIEKGEMTKEKAIADTSKNLVALYKSRGEQQTFAQQKVIDAQIVNQKKLYAELLNLGKENKIKEDATLGGAKEDNKAAEDKLKAKEDSLNALTELDIKADAASLAQTAKTESEKIEILRGAAIQEVMVAEKAAIDAGNARIDAELITQNALSNINKTFDDQQAVLVKKQNEDDWADAIAQSEDLGDKEAKIAEKQQAKRLDAHYKAEKEASEKEKKLQEQKYQTLGTLIDSYGAVSANITEQKIQDSDKETELAIKNLGYELSAKRITQEQYEAQIAVLEKQKQEKQNIIRKEQYERDKQIAVAKIIIATAQAVISQFAETGYAGAILAGVVGAAELAIVLSQPTPKFEKGGKVKGNRHSAGGTLIEAERDEFIINRNDAMKNDKLLKAINEGNSDKYIFDHYIAPSLRAQQKKHSEGKDASFAKNLASSMSLNFKDHNLLDSMKMSRKNDKEIAMYMVSELKKNNRNPRNW